MLGPPRTTIRAGWRRCSSAPAGAWPGTSPASRSVVAVATASVAACSSVTRGLSSSIGLSTMSSSTLTRSPVSGPASAGTAPRLSVSLSADGAAALRNCLVNWLMFRLQVFFLLNDKRFGPCCFSPLAGVMRSFDSPSARLSEHHARWTLCRLFTPKRFLKACLHALNFVAIFLAVSLRMDILFRRSCERRADS